MHLLPILSAAGFLRMTPIVLATALLSAYVRALLPNDDWLDFAQHPFAVAASVATAVFAKAAGASPVRATSFGLAIGPLLLEGPEAGGPMFTLGLPPPYDD